MNIIGMGDEMRDLHINWIIPVILIILIMDFLIFNQPVFPFIALGIIAIMADIFENRNYQNKFLYFPLIAVILSLVLIITYFQMSSPSYNGNLIYDYSIIGIFVILTICLVYWLFSKMKKYQKTVSIYQDAIKINPKDTKAWNNEGTALAGINEYQKAMKCFDKVLEIDHKDGSAWHNKGVILEKLRKPQEALKYYDKALELDPKLEKAKKTGKIILES